MNKIKKFVRYKIMQYEKRIAEKRRLVILSPAAQTHLWKLLTAP